MQRFGSFFFVALFLVFMFIARMKEHLNCEAKADSNSITCVRTQDRIFTVSKKTHIIEDLNSIEMIKRKIGNKHNIIAKSVNGKKVVLLSVPEKKTEYADEIIQQLKNLPQAEVKSIEYVRNEMHSQLLLLAVVGLVVLVSVAYLFKKKKPTPA